MRGKRGNTFIIVMLILILLLLLVIFLTIIYLSPSFSGGEGLVKKTRDGVEDTATKIEEKFGAFKGERIEELKPEQLPIGVDSGRVLYNIENETLTLMNYERTRRNLQALRLDERIANVAFSHSREMNLNDYINHTNLASKGPGDRISDQEIFALCSSENIYFIESREPRENLAERAVQGWLDSPGHRKNLLDPNITTAGIGIYCQDRKCYVTANHICTKTALQEELQDRYVYFFSLYPEEINFNTKVMANFDLSLTTRADLYIVPDKEQYLNYVDRQEYLFSKQYLDVEGIRDTVVVEKGYGLMVIPSSDGEIRIQLEYS
ncbi:MAG TPA: CAP domain-containing protein [Nanoarchaeota archaeon]|nr:CAP domain-containing protein [Nanoarchaeota archaeon]HIH66487.1 CAP domain-containing protein [Nanoarchaeota archaeon]